MSFESMLPTPPEGLTVPTLISAKGAQLRFWIIQANEASEKKVLKLSGTVDQQRTKLAEYYGFDLSVIPRSDAATVPTLDESIRDRQWADFVKLGVEWKETVAAGGVFRLLRMSLFYWRPRLPHLRLNETHEPTSTSQIIPLPSPLPNHSAASSVVEPVPSITVRADNPSINSTVISTNTSRDMSHSLNSPPPEAALLDDLSKEIEGLARCDGLQDIIQQVESGKVASIRARYGPSDGRRGTADPSWPKYKNIVSKRERLYRILSEDFAGDKQRFFTFFTVPQIPKKRKRDKEESDSPEDHFRSFRKIVEAAPWCESDLQIERRNEKYIDSNGNFSDALWTERWGTMNGWEIWREVKGERYEKEKKTRE
ncbi:hypothetical protein R3P38DRAFT_3609370 [Favolaschia claudopus]|uniref:Uncharacterized protein n=1 Tax=Favolaschia claudopus TaxID=2862362 RepID=A0AAW0A7E9_9AGAR